jgi:hypothetical protein
MAVPCWNRGEKGLERNLLVDRSEVAAESMEITDLEGEPDKPVRKVLANIL